MAESAVIITPLGEALDLLKLHALRPERYPHLLCSASQGGGNQYDILFAFPEETLCLTREGLSGDWLASAEPQTEDAQAGDFLQALDNWFQSAALAQPNTSGLPFTGGWFVYLAYELAQQIEPSLQLPLPDEQPLAFATRFSSALIVDRHSQQLLLVQEADSARQSQVQEQVREDLRAARDINLAAGSVPLNHLQEAPTAGYLRAVERIKNYIRDGDVFQANLSRLWQGELRDSLSSAVLFASLRRHNPSPFAALLHFPGLDVISSSPERLISVQAGQAQTRPIAGTRPRRAGADDQAVSDALLAHPKERSEHIMLIDLERNDLGRICQPGSIDVNELMVLESYAHVHHIVSNVRGQLRPEVLPGQAIAAVFPGGTITGCPKVRCMEILAELEGEARGAYTGSLGYINRNGDMDLNILIRTLVRQGDTISFRAGGGIVADSIADKELEETRAKARGMLNVFQTGGDTAPQPD